MTYFIGGGTGAWQVVKIEAVAGAALERVPYVAILEENEPDHLPQGRWLLRGVTSYERYVTGREQDELSVRQPPLGRPDSTFAALIPVRKSAAWWSLAQNERRAIFEERSAHIATGLQYLPAVARRLYHCRDLGEPFDFITWFEYAPQDAEAFEELVAKLRASDEWSFVEREIDIRLTAVR